MSIYIQKFKDGRQPVLSWTPIEDAVEFPINSLNYNVFIRARSKSLVRREIIEFRLTKEFNIVNGEAEVDSDKESIIHIWDTAMKIAGYSKTK